MFCLDSKDDVDVPEESGSEAEDSAEDGDEEGTDDEGSEVEQEDTGASDEEEAAEGGSDEDEEDEGGEDQAASNPNAGWADVMAKILKKETPNSKPVILQKNKQLEKMKEKAKVEILERKKHVGSCILCDVPTESIVLAIYAHCRVPPSKLFSGWIRSHCFHRP